MAALIMAVGVAGCSKDEPEAGAGSTSGTGSSDATANGGYGVLGGNLITIGSTRDVTYTGCVLLGTVDFPKITSDHTYGVVYMEGVNADDFDYEMKLQYGGHSASTDKVKYDCLDATITNSTADGKFEKQLVGLKPATTYYYRAYVRIGQNINYSNVESVTTADPSPEITMSTGDASEVLAVAATMDGVVNVGYLQDINEAQVMGFIYTTYEQLGTPDKLTYEYYETWNANHFETDEELESPKEVSTTKNMNGRISCDVKNLTPGQTYYYRTFFKWNNKYFYSPEVKTFTTYGPDELSVGTGKASDVTNSTATLNASFSYSKVGLENITCGFMISDVYSSASEFSMESAQPWNERNEHPDCDVYYVQTVTDNKDFSIPIASLFPDTEYYVRSYIVLESGEIWAYGSMQSFRTEAGTSPSKGIEISSEGSYPWTESNGVWSSGNKGVGSSESQLLVVVSHKSGDTLRYNVRVSSEASHDVLTVTDNSNGATLTSTLSGSYIGEQSIRFNKTGQTAILFTYKKDSRDNGGKDCVMLTNFRIE